MRILGKIDTVQDIMETQSENPLYDEDNIVHHHPLPPAELERYSMSRDPAAEQDITNYVQAETLDETVMHVERVRTEYIIGEAFEIWDVTTAKAPNR